MALLTPDDLRVYMSNANFSEEAWTSAEKVIAGVQGQLETYLNRPIEPVLVQERVQANVDGSLYFRATPVWKIVSVIDSSGNALDITGSLPNPSVPQLPDNDWENYQDLGVQRQIDFMGSTFNGWVPLDYGSISIGYPGAFYAVKYVAGLIGWNDDDIIADMYRICAREMTYHHDDSASLKNGETSDNEPLNPVLGWSEDELKRHQRKRRLIAV